jgi:hypothetical protein
MDHHTQILSINELTQDQEIKLIKNLGGRSPFGFYAYYFNELPYHKTNKDAFDHVNSIYFDLFGEYRYSSFDVFRKVYARNHYKQ